MPDEHRQHVQRALFRTGGTVVAIIVVYFAVPIEGDRWWPAALVGGLVVFATLPLAVRRLIAVLHSERPIIDAVEALALLLVMLVIGFSAVYVALDHNDGQFAGLETRVDALYFTVTTLSTVGFGDISASGQVARLVVTLQIIFNLAFVGIAVRAFIAAARRAEGLGPDGITRAG
jgi:voltage-gated potassium channel